MGFLNSFRRCTAVTLRVMPPGSNLMVFEMFINDTVKDMNGGAAVCSDGFKGERLKTVSVTLRVCTVFCTVSGVFR